VLTAKERLEDRGFKVKYRDDLFAVEGYLAGTDERRAEELMQAFLDPEVDAIFTTRGGYGCMRMLDKLDYDAISKHPKILVGYSDITALHLALNRRSHLITFHGPGPASGLSRPEDMTPFMAEYFYRALEGSGSSGVTQYTIEVPPDVAKVESLGHGKARGRLVGGNLSLVSDLEDTPYAIETDGAVLLLEDVSEAPYRIDRMLRQLKLAGKLSQIKAAVLGEFSRPDEREDSPTNDPRFSIEGVLKQYFADAGIPVLMNYPIGHGEINCTVPLGALVEVDADAKTLTIIEEGRPL
jgi:muramoyltetrapeptide carboxypeptidase